MSIYVGTEIEIQPKTEAKLCLYHDLDISINVLTTTIKIIISIHTSLEKQRDKTEETKPIGITIVHIYRTGK